MATAQVEGAGAGFSFDLCKRNAHLASRGVQPPAPRKTGTTIAGIVFKVRGDLTQPGRAGCAPRTFVRICAPSQPPFAGHREANLAAGSGC